MGVSQHYKTGAKNMTEWWEVFTVALLKVQQMCSREMHWLANNKTITVSCWWLGEELPLNNRFLVHTTYRWWLLLKPGNLMESHPETQINDFHWMSIQLRWAVAEGPKAWRSWSQGSPRHFQSSALFCSGSKEQRPEWPDTWLELLSFSNQSRLRTDSQSTLQVWQPSRSGTCICFTWCLGS